VGAHRTRRGELALLVALVGLDRELVRIEGTIRADRRGRGPSVGGGAVQRRKSDVLFVE
jgi:hypothetical protein